MFLKENAAGDRFELWSPTKMPRASAFLWNRRMMIQVNCRGFAAAQFMQPDSAKYMHGPNIEAKTFMQPEHPYYAHHPGRFFYIKDETSGELFSIPYEPVRRLPDSFCFSAGKSDIQWRVRHLDLSTELQLSLPAEDPLEIWNLNIGNDSPRERKLSLYLYFPIGYMSWMNQSAQYHEDLGGVVASCIAPYQKVEEYFKKLGNKDKTFVLHDRPPCAFETIREVFEGEGGLHNPDALQGPAMGNGEALYETPVAALQYRLTLAPGASENFRFLAGPATDDAEIAHLRRTHLPGEGATAVAGKNTAANPQQDGPAETIRIRTPDSHFDSFVNHWLPRQVFYHGDVNRLTTDPQTRNYLQDNMGMSYIRPEVARSAFLLALSQQKADGSMPDGILLEESAELKYINQVPHTDHCVWLPVCLRAYLDETGDYSVLEEPVRNATDGEDHTVCQRITRALRWLFSARDGRDLSYIGQGDWCDPMNMVGYRGRGVSGWLTVATAHACRTWADIVAERGEGELSCEFHEYAQLMNRAMNRHLWDGRWYGRGITDDDVPFGIDGDPEGRIYLNPQSWALLAGTADRDQQREILQAVEEQLETPYGAMMLAPAYTAMREDVGRVTQKFPGSAENGSIYNHAGIFYVHALYRIGEADSAFRLMRKMLAGPGEEDYLQRGQMPVFVPNYYRGACYQFPRTAGRSSQLFNTGTGAWMYRSVIEDLFGLRGDRDGLLIRPMLPRHWPRATAERRFRGASFTVTCERSPQVDTPQVEVDGIALKRHRIDRIEAGKNYRVRVLLPDQTRLK
ncbi:GH36-type glycosyl hydrolase domain-containing protein [Microbulbifer halophilus]|uniref:GH36-type glycosyl hydrolase domain-containing protein n=1 Tax=Microbulbifer halophilus TaxID=453963 RepID=A0ABW5ECK7_9GAMM|nr:NdvB protein [Microbulbifer halophilus]MCW8126938.1 NdvB protein [Microbulbifer halophilus]